MEIFFNSNSNHSQLVVIRDLPGHYFGKPYALINERATPPDYHHHMLLIKCLIYMYDQYLCSVSYIFYSYSIIFLVSTSLTRPYTTFNTCS